jgi:hypothetical protein
MNQGPLNSSSPGSNKRTGGKFNADFFMQDIYREYRKHCSNPVDKKTFSRVCLLFNSFVMHDILLQGRDFKMPVRLGYLGIRKYKCLPFIDEGGGLHKSHLPVDYRATRELWGRDEKARSEKRLVRIINRHTDDYRYRFYWNKEHSDVPNQTAYSFIPLRANSRELARILKSDVRKVDFCEQVK